MHHQVSCRAGAFAPVNGNQATTARAGSQLRGGDEERD
jgi:hypothetical protein